MAINRFRVNMFVVKRVCLVVGLLSINRTMRSNYATSNFSLPFEMFYRLARFPLFWQRPVVDSDCLGVQEMRRLASGYFMNPAECSNFVTSFC